MVDTWKDLQRVGQDEIGWELYKRGGWGLVSSSLDLAEELRLGRETSLDASCCL